MMAQGTGTWLGLSLPAQCTVSTTAPQGQGLDPEPPREAPSSVQAAIHIDFERAGSSIRTATLSF